MPRSGQLGRRWTVEPNCSGLSAYLAGALVTHERALKICEASCVLRTAKPFFVPVVHSPLGAVGYVAAPELSSQRGRARTHGIRGSDRAHLGSEARSRAEECVTTSELNSAKRRGPGPRDMWQHRSPPRKEGEV
jgi:hypothetical protein